MDNTYGDAEAHMLGVGAAAPFHIATVGYDFTLIRGLWDRIQEKTGFKVSHLLHPSLDKRSLARYETANCFCMRDNLHTKLPPADTEYLASLEREGVPTVHNMIMGDHILRELNYKEALAYASYIGRRMEHLFRMIDPSAIVGGFDAFQGSMAMAVARKLNIPWFALSFSTIPTGLTGFSTSMDTGGTFAARPTSPADLRALAEITLREFQSLRLVAPTISTENSLASVIKYLPRRIGSLFRAITRKMTFRFDKFTHPSLLSSIRHYVRKRRNLIFLPTRWLIDTPPATPYLFIGLHMQPEMAIDVWAPFYSDQFNVIESIARSMPPTHMLLVKLHKIDADNYSRSQLDRLRSLPGVRLVSPFASSRAFLEKASVVFSIQGTITIEAAMLGRPVLVFGETAYLAMPNVTRVGRVTDLPSQIRRKLTEVPPGNEAIIDGLASLLRCYAPGCFNDWTVMPTDAQIDALATHFKALSAVLEERRAAMSQAL